MLTPSAATSSEQNKAESVAMCVYMHSNRSQACYHTIHEPNLTTNHGFLDSRRHGKPLLLRLQDRQEGQQAKADAAASRKAHYGDDDVGGGDGRLLRPQPSYSLSCNRTRRNVDGFGNGNWWGCGRGGRDGRLVETRLCNFFAEFLPFVF